MHQSVKQHDSSTSRHAPDQPLRQAMRVQPGRCPLRHRWRPEHVPAKWIAVLPGER
jgi:hypothetical protein